MEDNRRYKKNQRREQEPEGLVVVLRDGENVDSLIRRFRWVVEASGIMKDLKDREFYRSPGEKKRLKKIRAEKRRLKSLAKDSE